MVHKYYQCFRCKYHNHFNNIPIYVKGKCCRRCHTFNYFNYHPKKNNNNRNNYKKNNDINNRTTRTHKPNYTLLNNTNSITDSNTIRNENENTLLLNQFRIPAFNYNQEDIFNFNHNRYGFSNIMESNNINNNFDITGFEFDNNNIYNNNNDRISNFNNFGFGNMHNENNRNSNNNIFDYSNLYNENENNNISYSYYKKISWLNKEKFTENKIKKYGNNESCSICLENFKLNDEIYITKCNHIFLCKCIEEAINKNISDCPNCRSNLRTGEKKHVVNINNNNHNNNHNHNNNDINFWSNFNNYQRNNNLIYRNSIERNNEYIYNRNNENYENNNYNRNSEELSVFSLIVGLIFLFLIVKLLSF